nr:uncharacterized protein LOC109168299 [Ipomoea batatas]
MNVEEAKEVCRWWDVQYSGRLGMVVVAVARHEQPSVRNVLIAGSPTVAARLSQHRCSPRSPPSLLLASPSSARVALHRSLLCRAPTVERSRALPQTPSRALLFSSTVRPFPLPPLRRRLTPACQHSWMDGERIKCPCNQRKCQNTKFLDVPTVKFHLAKYEFVSDYYVWRFHGECNLRVDVEQDVGAPSQMASEEVSNAYHTMVMDAAGPEFNVDEIEESPNPEAQKFYDMLKAADQELWPGSKNHSQLSLVARLMSLKSENHISEKCFNQFTELMKEVIPEVEEMAKLENDIPLILCQLERIFPPSFFDSIEHLPIHLAYEARIAGPVQYRWMYPFERYLRKLKNNVKNKAKVEGSIFNAYLVEEASSFCSYYFEDHVSTKHRNVPRNADSNEYVVDEHEETLSIFKYLGRAFEKSKVRYMTDEEFKAAQTYVLLNCSEVEPFIE